MKTIKLRGELIKIKYESPSVVKLLFKDEEEDIYYLTLTKMFLNLKKRFETGKKVDILVVLQCFIRTVENRKYYQNDLQVISVTEVSNQ